jgi:hypothetical protein
MYLINILITIAFSLVNIVGSIITGKIPKGSIWQLIMGNLDMTDKDYWHDEDVSYIWRSRDEYRKKYNLTLIESSINSFCNSKKFDYLDSDEKEQMRTRIKQLLLESNRLVL